MLRITSVIIALLVSTPALAYIGPGAGISVLGSLLGIIVTIIVAIGAILMWPLRKLLKKKRAAANSEMAEGGTDAGVDARADIGDESAHEAGEKQ